MADVRVLEALGLLPTAADWQIAGRLRQLSGRSREDPTDVALWLRFYDGIELAREGPRGARGDEALLANRIVEHAIVPPGLPDEDRYGLLAWDRELGAPQPNADEELRRIVFEQIAPRLARAGLYTLL